MDFTGKTALITGGVSGIGFGIARAFAAAGIELVLTYRNAEYQAQAAAWFRQQGRPQPRFLSLDVTDRARWRAIAEEVGLTPLEVARAILSWEEATADDPAAADRLRLLREINPTFQPMDN